ncbi:hypothetical protein [Novosphingopyxis iocasae]|uniref:hypothetical protein n=1 Tax=Novosphingopyxis iocasae TaxID=2762729 RepID=UPI0016511613|nr:hypothetical protein [Novosphingopyxis iocasae]
MPKNKTPTHALATSVGLDSYAIANTAIAATQLFKIPARHPHGEGPWDDEADKIAWIDERTGTPCIILRQANGTLSGYAAVEPGHPLYGYNHDAIPSELRVVSHGGLNYAEACNQTMPEAISVCHVEPPKRPHTDMPDRFAHDGDLWWFGFDTNHVYDFVPNERVPEGQRIHDGKVYRDQAYVYRECIKLAAQLHRIETGIDIPIPAHLQQTIPPIGGTD